MRTLTSRQKKLLDKCYEEYKPAWTVDLRPEHWDKLEKMNDTEILWQETDRYLQDKWAKDASQKKSPWQQK